MNNLENRLIKYIESLGKDIDNLRNRKKMGWMREAINESDATLIEDIKEDLEKLLEG